MTKTVDTLSILLETVAVFIASVLIAFFAFLYAILYQWISFLPISTVITFNQLVSAFIYAVLLSAIIAFVYHRWRRR